MPVAKRPMPLRVVRSTRSEAVGRTSVSGWGGTRVHGALIRQISTENGMRGPLLKKNLRDPKCLFILFWLFLSQILSRRCRLSRTTSDPAQKSGKNQAKIAFFLFFRRRFWHDFVTPFSTFANIKGSLPTNSTTSDRLRFRAKTDGDFFPGLGVLRTSSKKSFFKRSGI